MAEHQTLYILVYETPTGEQYQDCLFTRIEAQQIRQENKKIPNRHRIVYQIGVIYKPEFYEMTDEELGA